MSGLFLQLMEDLELSEKKYYSGNILATYLNNYRTRVIHFIHFRDKQGKRDTGHGLSSLFDAVCNNCPCHGCLFPISKSQSFE